MSASLGYTRDREEEDGGLYAYGLHQVESTNPSIAMKVTTSMAFLQKEETLPSSRIEFAAQRRAYSASWFSSTELDYRVCCPQCSSCPFRRLLTVLRCALSMTCTTPSQRQVQGASSRQNPRRKRRRKLRLRQPPPPSAISVLQRGLFFLRLFPASAAAAAEHGSKIPYNVGES